MKGLTHLKGGTVSICFTGELEGRVRFFKTLVGRRASETLKLEAELLQATTGERTSALLIQGTHGGRVQQWLQMAMLEASPEVSGSAVLEMVNSYETLLRGTQYEAVVPQERDIRVVLHEAKQAVCELSEMGLLSEEAVRRMSRCVDRVQESSVKWTRQLCHGDLGPANIMRDRYGLVPVDWEDAIWAFPQYDYLYWLTFMKNRPLLNRRVLGITPLGPEREVAVMAMIIVLKSAISVRNKSYLHNTTSINDRVLEVMRLV